MTKNTAKGAPGKDDFDLLYAEAARAGHQAAADCIPVPMVVGQATSLLGTEIDVTKTMYFVEGGVCGFAWITVRPGTCRLARWLVKSGYASAAFSGGVVISVVEFGQSMARKEAYARAFAEVFRQHGFNAYADSRLD